jgi:hypothetical protein
MRGHRYDRRLRRHKLGLLKRVNLHNQKGEPCAWASSTLAYHALSVDQPLASKALILCRSIRLAQGIKQGKEGVSTWRASGGKKMGSGSSAGASGMSGRARYSGSRKGSCRCE